jgi:hypothetical protein
MKKLFFIALLFTLFSACKKECDSYHTGSNCQTEKRILYFGTYYGSTVGGVVTSFTVSTVAGDASKVSIDGAVAKFTSLPNFNIDLQTIYINGVAHSISGSGFFSQNSILMNFIFDGHSDSFSGNK